MMNQALTLHALADTRFNHQVCGALLEHARADSLFDVLPTPSFQHD
jgi:hypothetical protein